MTGVQKSPTQAQIQALQARGQDLDGNGKVSPWEAELVTQFAGSLLDKNGNLNYNTASQMLTLYDSNHDGKITNSEYTTNETKWLKKRKTLVPSGLCNR